MQQLPSPRSATDTPLLLDCSSCEVTDAVPLDDADRLRDVARRFFLAHADCRTRVGLDGPELRGWAVPQPAA